MSNIDTDKVLANLSLGESIPSQATVLNISRSKLHKEVKKETLYLVNKKVKKIGSVGKARICQLYQLPKHPWTMSAIAHKYKVSVRTIEKILINAWIPRRKTGRIKSITAP